jgi:hypothetical protein
VCRAELLGAPRIGWGKDREDLTDRRDLTPVGVLIQSSTEKSSILSIRQILSILSDVSEPGRDEERCSAVRHHGDPIADAERRTGIGQRGGGG